MKRSPFLVILLLLLLPTAARSTTCAVSHVFATGETLTAAILNMNPTAEVNCANNVDNQNIGAAGIYATQLVPITGAQGLFGGSIGYTFPNGIVVRGALAGVGLFDTVNGTTPQKTLRSNGSNGNFEILNNAGTTVLSLSDTGKLQAGTPLSYVGPTYTATGTAVPNTAHTVVGSCTPAATANCNVTLTGNAVFTSAATYACAANPVAFNAAVNSVYTNSGAAFIIATAAANSTPYSYVCTGY